MNFPVTFFINESGLFDFDLTFPAEAFLFIILALVVTFVFISPVSKQMEERAQFVNYNLRTSSILLTFGEDQLSKCIGLLIQEINEMTRQIKLVKTFTNLQFEEQINIVQKENLKIITKLKGDLAIKSAYLFLDITEDLLTLTDTFFVKKFKIVS